LVGLFLVVVVVGSELLAFHQDVHKNEFQHGESLTLYGDDSHSRQFLGAISFTLIISLPTMIDLCLSLTFLTTWRELKQSIEFSRLFIILVIAVPNIFIFWQIVPAVLVDLVMFCQDLCIFFALIYRLYTLSTATQTSIMIAHVYPVRDVFFISICAIILGLLFKLSTHELLPGRFIWKVLYTVTLVLLNIVTCLKLKPWFNFTWQISKVVKNHVLWRNKISFVAVIFGIIASSGVTVAHLATFNQEFVYFPTKAKSFIAHEWLFCGVLIFWTAIRNFDIRKSQIVTEVSSSAFYIYLDTKMDSYIEISLTLSLFLSLSISISLSLLFHRTNCITIAR
jgi:hypothetical protein